MKKFVAAIAVILASALMFNLGVASADAGIKTAQGKTVSFANGKLKVRNNQGIRTYIVDKGTDCGYSRGQMGDAMPCSNLRKSRFMNKRVTVYWFSKNGKRVAELVGVYL